MFVHSINFHSSPLELKRFFCWRDLRGEMVWAVRRSWLQSWLFTAFKAVLDLEKLIILLVQTPNAP